MLRVLIDTCVWLDLAKDYRQRPLITALETLIEAGELELIVPELIVEEFMRNKDRVVEESRQSLSSYFKRVRDAVAAFGDDDKKGQALAQISEVNHRLAMVGEASNESIGRIESLFGSTPQTRTTDDLKLRAANRALQKLAPFHRQRNGIDDAILIELYADEVVRQSQHYRLAFVTHNIKDFSAPGADSRLPHPDIAALFSDHSTYETALASMLNEASPETAEDLKIELEFENQQSRRLSEILEAERRMEVTVWYNRHQIRRQRITLGKIRLVDETSTPKSPGSTIRRDIWEGALAAARAAEDEFGIENLGPFTDYEWGMINGKLSALRWVLGDDWDMLHT